MRDLDETGAEVVKGVDGRFEIKPTFIVQVGIALLGLLCPKVRGKGGAVPIAKWRGSFVTSPRLP